MLLVVSLTLDKSEYRVTEGEISVRVCANFSETDVIDRTVLATLETLPSDSAMGKLLLALNSTCSTYSFLHTAMTDFVPVVQTLTFNSNVLLCVDVEIYDDSVLEDTETFSITLSSSDPQVIVGAVGVASIIISDDDCKLSPHSISSLDPFFLSQLWRCLCKAVHTKWTRDCQY